jgi:hypothetical protein
MHISVFTTQRFASLHNGLCIAVSRFVADMLSVSFHCGAWTLEVLGAVQT